MAKLQKSILVVYTLASGSVLAFVILNWQVYGGTRTGVLLYLFLPLAGFVTSWVFFFTRWHQGRGLFVSITLAVLAAAYLFEAYVFLSSEAQFGESGIPRSEIRASLAAGDFPIFLPLAPHDVAAGVPMGPSELVVPLGGVPLVQTAAWLDPAQEPEIFFTDRYGFRNNDSVWDSQKIRLAAVGDSYVFGAESTTENSFVGRIRMLEPSIINLGRGGNGPLAELATIKEYLTDLEPDLVLWFYYKNDLEQDIFGELHHPTMSRYLETGFSQNLASRGEMLATSMREDYLHRISLSAAVAPDGATDQLWFEKLRFTSGANPLNQINFIILQRTRTFLGLLKGGGDWPDPPQKEMTNILGHAKGLVGQWGGDLVFIYLPSWTEVIGRDKSKFGFRNAALEAARLSGIPVVDLLEDFKFHPDPKSLWPSRQPGHYGPIGNAFVAEKVLGSLRELGLWPISD